MSADELPSLAEVTAALTAPGAMFEMEDVVVDGVTLRAWKNAPPTLRELLDLSRVHGDVEFLVYDAEAPGAIPGPFDRVTFRDHAAASRNVRPTPHRRPRCPTGRSGDDRHAQLPEWSIAFWGAAAAGAVVVPLNAWWTGPELTYGLADSGSKVAIADLERAERIGEHRAELPDLEAVIVARAGRDAIPGTIAFEDAIGTVESDTPLPDVILGPDDDATIFYTSGTTGQPKGALGTHRNICTNLISLGYCVARSDALAQGRLVLVGTQRAQHLPALGAVLPRHRLPLGPRRQPRRRWGDRDHAPLGRRAGAAADRARAGDDLRWRAGHGLAGARASGLRALRPVVGEVDRLRRRACGAELVRRLEAMFPGRTPSNGYGLTETSSVTTMNCGLDYQRQPDSVGVPDPGLRRAGRRPRGTGAADGEIGELWIKGPNVVKGYWNKPEETAAAITDGWLHSGDVARVDDEGFVFIVDRAKDMIIRGGENVYCVEVEAALFEHPSVTDAAAIGIPHHVLGEEVGAVVHLAPGTSASEDELREFVGARIAAFKVPVRIWFKEDRSPATRTARS